MAAAKKSRVKRAALAFCVLVLALVAGGAGILLSAGGPNAMARRALAAYEEGSFSEARRGYESALEQDPAHAPSLIGLTEVAIAEQDPDRIREHGERAIELSQDPAQRARLRLGLAQTRLDDGDYASAYSLAEQAGQDDAQSGAGAMQGLARLGEGNLEEAFRLLEAAAKGGSSNSRVYSALTQLHLGRKEDSLALAAAEKAVELSGDDPALWLILADLRDQAGTPSRAKAALLEVIQREDANATAHARLATLLIGEGALDEARVSAQKAHELAPKNPLSVLVLARVHLASGHASEALALLEQSKDTAGWEGSLLLGGALLAAGRKEEGVAMLDRAGAARPDDATAQRAIGSAALAGGAHEAALRFTQASLEIEANAGARVQLARALAALDRGENHAKILDQLKAARELDPANSEAALELGRHLVEVGSPDRALQVLDEALESFDDPALMFWKGRACLAARSWEEAVNAFEAVQASAPDYPELGEWLQRAMDRSD